MATNPPPDKSGSVGQGIAGVTTIAAATLLLVAGLLGLLQGISAVAKDQLIVVGQQYVYNFDVTTWGWIHIVVGIIAILVAIGMYAGAAWARVVAIIIAALSLILNFLWLPYYPWWSIVIIAVDIIVIWAVATWRTE
ncbi:hypothetical protein GYA93_08305 [Gordonia desulfuricans]|uniref:DUF7144 domain-containing protein n=1 Tax=Gordonia desulfuricans TaxID=89051 RepID=A0A7K3LPX2_9ACTN|nr:MULTISPECIES: hypothetical protein [Gordonia]EMP10438.1 membrane protein [Gordonia sp. NB41Y]NDK89577.1 hypothetical protein [Gordonia desulfuricans]WLP92593.1 hypothetical protein Q9K23_10380 [Gordonia sp. NB41Y]